MFSPRPVPPKSRAVLEEMIDYRVIVGTLGEFPLRPNKRIFRKDDGTELSQYIVVFLLRNEYIKVVADDGARREFVITERGMDAVTVRQQLTLLTGENGQTVNHR